MTYDWRIEPCECDEGKTYATDREGYFERGCEMCGGEGEVDASCCECDRIVPLNSDGICEKCQDAADLPLAEFVAKYSPHIYLRDAA